MSRDVDVLVYERLARLETLAQAQAATAERIEGKIDGVSSHLDTLRMWKAKVTGVAAAAAAGATIVVRFVEAAFK